jgi:hypothetical protein
LEKNISGVRILRSREPLPGEGQKKTGLMAAWAARSRIMGSSLSEMLDPQFVIFNRRVRAERRTGDMRIRRSR